MHTRFASLRSHAHPMLLDDEYPLNKTDQHWLRQAFVWAHAARTRGNRPFGAIVVNGRGRILAEAFSNTQETGDSTSHAEMNAVRQLGTARLTPNALTHATLYCSAQPCAMCASAICAVGVRRVVYGLDSRRLEQIHPNLRPLQLSCHDVFASAVETVECAGPCLVQEALAVVEDRWFYPEEQRRC